MEAIDILAFVSLSLFFSNYLSTYKNLEYSTRINSFMLKKSTFNNSNSKVISLKYNYDILNKGNIISKVIYSKNFIIKY